MQSLTAKELEYIVDSMSNEDLLIKQCVATAVHAQNQEVHNFCMQLQQRHQQHYQQLMYTLQQRLQLAPTQPQSERRT